MVKSRIILMVTTLAVVCSSAVLAEVDDVWWGSWYSQGNIAPSIRVAFESPSGYSGGLGAYPGVEMILFKPDFNDVAPLDIGVAARGHLGFSFDAFSDSNFTAGVGLFGTAHAGFRGLDFLDPNLIGKLDYFLELGFGFDLIRYDANSRLHFSAFTGLNYHLTPKLAVTVGYSQWGDISGGYVGAQLRIGAAPEVKALEVRAPSGRVVTPGQLMMAQRYVVQFYAIYWYAFTAGGLYFDDSSYDVGDGTVWELTGSDGDDAIMLEKALLREEPDGSRWWRVAFTIDGDRFIYEYLIGPDYTLIEMVYKDVSEDMVGEYVFTGEESVPFAFGAIEPITAEDYGEHRVRSEQLTVEAGTFETDFLRHEVVGQDDTWTYSWWVSDRIPGNLVKFLWKFEESDEWMQGELLEITRGNRPELFE